MWKKYLVSRNPVALFGLAVIFTFIFFAIPREVLAVNWQISGYYPTKVPKGVKNNAVTVNGSFSTYREGRKVKFGVGNSVVYDLSPQVIAWTMGQIKVVIPGAVSAGNYWIGIYTPDDNLLVKGPQTFTVSKPQEIAHGSGTKKKNMGVAKGMLKILPAELEIAKVSGLPDHVCAETTYPLSLTVINHGGGAASFHVCTAGSLSFQCTGGTAAVKHIDAHSTTVVPMNIRPDKTFFADGYWHGKIFLGKVKTPQHTQLTFQDQSAPNPTGCNEVVTTSWTNAPGLSVGSLFCDGNMRNHLRILAIRASNRCGEKLNMKGMKIHMKKKGATP